MLAFDSHKVPQATTNSKKPAMTAIWDCDFTFRLLLFRDIIRGGDIGGIF